MSRIDPFVSVLRADPCSFCGAPAEVLDHIEPRARGGADSVDNLTSICTPCNQSKGALSLLAFLHKRNRPLTRAQQMRRQFGRNVRARRVDLGLSQKELALAIGADLMCISRWERGASDPRGDSAVLLARALCTDLFHLYAEPSEAAA